MLPPHALDSMYRTFYEISPDLICTLDEKGTILDVNKHMLEHLG
jgi:PAS domain S-box-containing protein